MSDIHQEWEELRQKNGDFINHLDGEMAKLKQDKQLQDLLDAGAFAMQFVAPPQFNCCQDDRDILKALNKAQADRIKFLEDEFLACKEQQRIDQAVKKDLDEKLDKAAADYKALWVEKEQLKERVATCNKVNAALRQRSGELQETVERLTHCDTYAQQGMQSKIAKQAAEIKRLTEENKNLRNHNARMSNMIDRLNDALDIAAKDAEANFERGKIKGMGEIWDELMDVYAGRLGGENEKIFGYCSVGDVLMNLSPTWFMNKAREYHEQKEKKEARDIKLGDEVEIFDQCDHSLKGPICEYCGSVLDQAELDRQEQELAKKQRQYEELLRQWQQAQVKAKLDQSITNLTSYYGYSMSQCCCDTRTQMMQQSILQSQDYIPKPVPIVIKQIEQEPIEDSDFPKGVIVLVGIIFVLLVAVMIAAFLA